MKKKSLKQRFSKPNVLFKSVGILIILAIINHFIPMDFVMNLLIFIGADLLAILTNN